MLTQEAAREIELLVFRLYRNCTPAEIMIQIEEILLKNNIELSKDKEPSAIYEIISWFVLCFCNYGKTDDNFFSIIDRKMEISLGKK